MAKNYTLAKWTAKRPLELFLFIWSIVKQYLPHEVRQIILRHTRHILDKFSPYIHLYIDEFSNDAYQYPNFVYSCVRSYLGEHGANTSKNFRLHAPSHDKRVFRMKDDEEVTDCYKGVTVWWVSVTETTPRRRSYKLMFHRKNREFISGEYLDHVINEGKKISRKNRTRKLYLNRGLDSSNESRLWTSVNFNHPASFDTLAMDPCKKKEIVDDLLKFKSSKDYYARMGKAWKRGYLLYGPPGTGKSTMIATMANFLEYDLYDLELTAVSSNEQLRRLLISTGKRSIIAIEDIDCSLQITGKRNTTPPPSKSSDGDEKKRGTVTLSGLLNFIDGIWSASEGERIIIFTTNTIDKLDPALIRTGRMDKHIELSYCCFEGFKVLAKNYLMLEGHPKFDVVRSLLEVTKMTPADVGEHLMPKVVDDDDEKCLDKLIQALEKAKDRQIANAKKKAEKANDILIAKAAKANDTIIEKLEKASDKILAKDDTIIANDEKANDTIIAKPEKANDTIIAKDEKANDMITAYA